MTSDLTVDSELVLLPPGKYHLRFIDWFTVLYMRKQPKVELRFVVVEHGEHCGKRLSRWCNVKELIGKPRRRGRFKVGRSSDLLRDYARLVGGRFRLDRMALSTLEPLTLVGQVETVERDRQQRDIPASVRYSTIRSLELA